MKILLDFNITVIEALEMFICSSFQLNLDNLLISESRQFSNNTFICLFLSTVIMYDTYLSSPFSISERDLLLFFL